MKTLHLTLNKKWFDMILSGEKKEEYREMKLYWKKRLIVDPRLIIYQFKKFERIVFVNGYARNSPTMLIECNGISVGIGKEEWGHPRDKCTFIISLGKIIEAKNV